MVIIIIQAFYWTIRIFRIAWLLKLDIRVREKPWGLKRRSFVKFFHLQSKRRRAGRNKIEYQWLSGYGASNESTHATPDTRNFTPSMMDFKSFERKEVRNLTSESNWFRNVPPSKPKQFSLNKINDFGTPGSFKDSSKHLIRIPNHARLVYISPGDYRLNNRKSLGTKLHNGVWT